jgi:monothiol glutaredoxin
MTNPTFDKIKSDISSHDVVLYMKGTKAMPQCGFSATVVEVLKRCGIEEFKDVNVLADQEIREGIKQFANWPTIPQLYVKGEFIGGCDIVREMYQSGELEALLREKGIAA